MTKTIWTGVCTALVAFATAAIGQTTSAPQPNASSSERRITVTGCLKQAPSMSTDTATSGAAGATGTTGTTGTTATGTAGAAADPMANAKFILTNASATDSSSAQGAAASGTTSGGAATGTTATGTTATGTATGTTATGTTASGTSATGTSAGTQASGTTASAQTYRLIANPTALSPHVGKKLELTGTLEDQSGTAHPDAAGGPDANAPALRVEAGKVIAASCSQ
jgi:hypothetical protein